MADSFGSDATIATGSLDFSGGVDSVKVTTVYSSSNPEGLKSNELSWLNNGTVRDGGITQRTGWQPLTQIFGSAGLFQGGFLYEPANANPHLIVSISGHIYRVLCEAPYTVTELINPGPYTATNPRYNPATQPLAFFCQGEQFLIIQAGDLVTLPLFYDGITIRRSIGIVTASPLQAPGQNELPAATCMDYFQGRLWFAQGRTYGAGDIVGGSAGTAKYSRKDAILNVTECPLIIGGDNFTVPDNAGNIRALKHAANLDSTLGQGNFYIFTRKAVYSLAVPTTRTDWIATTGSNIPKQTVVLLNNGSVNDRSVVAVNSDLYFQSLEPNIRSFVTATRYFSQPGNIPISANEQRILQFNDRSLMQYSSGIYFDNRLLQAVLPVQRPQGVVNQAIIPFDFVPANYYQTSTKTPNWEGHYDGLDFFQLFAGDFGGRERAFGAILSRADSSIQLWELTNSNRFENGDNRVQWYFESPAWTWGDEFLLKELAAGELWVDKLFGDVIFTVEYRPDSDTCWYPWHHWQVCSARTSCEDVNNPVCGYPATAYREGFRQTMTLPKPKPYCNASTGRPSTQGFQFQLRVTIKGWCRVRGILLHAYKRQRALYEQLICKTP